MIDGLLRWYAARCDGEWENRYGFVIESCDNPGLQVSVDIPGEAALRPDDNRVLLSRPGPDRDLLEVRVRDRKLIGFASPGLEARLFDELDTLLGA